MMRIAIILLTLLISNEVVADIYKFTDTDGRVYYTDEPRHSLYKRIIKSKITPHYPHNYLNKYTVKFMLFQALTKKNLQTLFNRLPIDIRLMQNWSMPLFKRNRLTIHPHNRQRVLWV